MSKDLPPDVVIVGEDGEVYHLTEDQLKKYVMPDGEDRRKIQRAVNAGCGTATVSKSDPGLSWYAVGNLARWKAPDSD